MKPDLKTWLAVMVQQRVITMDPDKAEECCGIKRDEHGFCRHSPYHPIYVPKESVADMLEKRES